MKDTQITESTKLELRFEFYNLFNHTQFDPNGINTDFNSSGFGTESAAFAPRTIQLGGQGVPSRPNLPAAGRSGRSGEVAKTKGVPAGRDALYFFSNAFSQDKRWGLTSSKDSCLAKSPLHDQPALAALNGGGRVEGSHSPAMKSRRDF